MLDCASSLREVVVPFAALVRPAGECCVQFWASQHRKHMSKLESWRKLGLKTHDVHGEAARPGLGEPREGTASHHLQLPGRREDEEADPWEHSGWTGAFPHQLPGLWTGTQRAGRAPIIQGPQPTAGPGSEQPG